MQELETPNKEDFTDVSSAPKQGRIIAIDPGTKRIGVAISDELQIAIKRLPIIKRASWKKLLADVKATLAELDAKALVIGLPLNTDGTESEMSAEAREMARKFALSLDIPVFLQDERVTTYEARGYLWKAGKEGKELAETLDSEAAAIILADFLGSVKI